MRFLNRETALSWAVAGSTFLSSVLGGAAVESTIQGSNIEVHSNRFALIYNEQVIEAPPGLPPRAPARSCPLQE
jgi:hypothetical protein